MRFPFIHTKSDTTETLMVMLDTTPHVIDTTHARYQDILNLVTSEFHPSVLAERTAEITDLLNFAEPAIEKMRQLSERVSVFGGTLYFDGDPIDTRLADHILAKLDSGDDEWAAPVRFLENLMANPAKHVRKRLFDWISDRGLTLTPEGLVVGYKGTRGDEQNTSVSRGVNTVWVDGVAHTGHIPNPVGATLVMARSQVDNDRDVGCSHGLHVGTFDYALGFTQAPAVLVVTFDPRDVVAIPRDEDYAKIRVCRYTVLARTEVKIDRTTWTPDEDTIDYEEEEEDEEEVTLCSSCGDETEDGEPTCDDCLAREDAAAREDEG